MNWAKAIAILLVCNAAMLGYLIIRRPHPTSVAPVLTQSAKPSRPPAPTSPSSPETVTVTNNFHWQQLESEDYRSYIQRLRSIGCPETTIRDIIIADLDRLFSPRLRALQPYRENLAYWQPEDEELLNNVNDLELLRQERAVEQEKRTVMKELTGVDLSTERLKLKGQEDYYNRRLGFLPEEKRWDVRRAVEDYHDQTWAIRQKQLDGDGLDDQARADLTRLRKERDVRLNQLLSPEERKTFDLWMSEAASQVRHDVYGMDATEQEFQTIYQARQKFDAQWPHDEVDLENPAVQQTWQAAQDQMERGIRMSLGEERFLAYKRGQDPDFHALSALTARHSLAPEVAAEVYGYKQAFLDYRDAIGYDGRLSPEQKQQTLSAIQEETMRVLRGRLGEVAYGKYVSKADWLRN